tara:strand:+ start:284 stop:1300 length:1017 start_codon:yes stop_codon:yes gene_type:complete
MLGLGANKTGALNVESATPTIGFAVVTTADTPTASSSGTATLSGSYTGSGVTEVGFDFGVNVAGFSEVTGTDSSGTITADVSNLSSLTEYKYRAYAKNSRGKAVGSIETFTSAEVIAAAGSPFHGTYGETPYLELQFTQANGTYDFTEYYDSLPAEIESIRHASITDEDGLTKTDVMEITADLSPANVNSAYMSLWSAGNLELLPYYFNDQNEPKKYSYSITFDCFIPSANSHIDAFGNFVKDSALPLFTSPSMGASTITTYTSSDVGSWKTLSFGSVSDAASAFGLDVNSNFSSWQSDNYEFGFYFKPTGGAFDDSPPGDKIYVRDVKIYRRQTSFS